MRIHRCNTPSEVVQRENIAARQDETNTWPLLCVCGSCSHVHGTEAEMETLRAMRKLNLNPLVCWQHKRNLNYCGKRVRGACTSRERQNSHSAITYLCILRRLFGARRECHATVRRPVVIVLIVPHTRARTKAIRTPHAYIGQISGEKFIALECIK